MTHSIGGGTGSGMGSFIMQKIKEEYPTQLLTDYAIVPSSKVSSVVVEPYNSMLSFHHMIENSDASIIIDNEALYDIAQYKLKSKNITFSTINSLVRDTMLANTASFRFGGYNTSGMRK